MGAGKRRRIVDAVANHNNLVIFTKRTDSLLLATGKKVGYNLVNPRKSSDSLCSTAIISRKHHNTKPHSLHLGNRLGAVISYGVGNCDKSERLTVFYKEDGSFSLCSQRLVILVVRRKVANGRNKLVASTVYFILHFAF